MLKSLTRAFAPGYWSITLFWGILSAWSVYSWMIMPEYNFLAKVFCVFDVVMLVFNLFVLWARRVIKATP